MLKQFAAATILTAALVAPARADLLGPVQAGAISGNYSAGFGTSGNLSDFGTAGITTANGSASVSIAGSPSPVLTVAGNQTAGGSMLGNFGGLAQLAYQFQVDGPTPTVLVHANALGLVGMSGTGTFSGMARVDLTVSNPLDNNPDPLISATSSISAINAVPQAGQTGSVANLLLVNAGGNATNGFGGSFTVDADYLFTTGVAYRVFLAANAGVSSDGTGLVSASIDPTFRLADSVANPGDYTLQVNSNVGNSAEAVPEPASLGLLLAGVAGLAVRRRRGA